MDTTDCLGLPYPECDPPAVKDSSDIEQFRDLALATDAAVQTYSDLLTDTLIQPSAVLMLGGVNSAAQDNLQFLNGGSLFDNAGMADNAADVIRIQVTGWYMVGGWVNASTATQLFVRAEPIVNGEAVSSRQGPSFLLAPGEQVTFTDVLYLQAGDALQMMTHHAAAPGPVITYNIRMWALEILRNV